MTFVEPSEEQVIEFGITWDFDAAYGGSTPIFSTWPPFQWPAARMNYLHSRFVFSTHISYGH